jgi:hypothetical protein
MGCRRPISPGRIQDLHGIQPGLLRASDLRHCAECSSHASFHRLLRSSDPIKASLSASAFT